MWCDDVQCGYGSENTILTRCPQCGNKNITDKNPVPKKPLRSIREMKKRIGARFDDVSKKWVVDEQKKR